MEKEQKMKKTVFKLIFVLLVISTFSMFFNILLTKSSPEKIYVDGTNITGPWYGTHEYPYLNITSGLAHASNGDTIFVYTGTYYERLTIDKAISLIGQNRYDTIIDGNRTGNVIEVVASNVRIAGFTIKNSGLFHYKLSGIYLEKTSYCNISHNIITYNYKGTYIVNSSNSFFTDNYLYRNLEAIYMADSSNNIFAENTLSNNEFAIVTTSSDNNAVVHSNFINNTKSISSIGSTNFWDNGMEGNYWSDYTGKDENQNGIGNSPYIIDANNQDNYPLMGAFCDFTVTYENESYHVFTVCNSTISEFQYNQTLKMLTFNITGIDDTVGFCRIMIPEQLINRPHVVLVDDDQINATLLPISNLTHAFLYLAYNHNIREIKILNKPYYELMQKYNALLKDYQNLNLTHYQLSIDYYLLTQTYQQTLMDYNSLNHTYQQTLENYTQLIANYETLNNVYQQLLNNYTELQDNYDTLNRTYHEMIPVNYTILKNKYDSLLEAHNLLNQTYQQTLANHTELLAKYYSLNHTYQELMANATKLQNDYNSIQTNHNGLLEQYNSLNSTYNKIESEYATTRITLWCVSVAAVAITVTTSSLTIKHHRRSKEQKKLIEKYKGELKRTSRLNIAQKEFEADVQRRRNKIKKFEQKHEVTVRTRDTLEDVIRSLMRKKKTEAEK